MKLITTKNLVTVTITATNREAQKLYHLRQKYLRWMLDNNLFPIKQDPSLFFGMKLFSDLWEENNSKLAIEFLENELQK